MFNFFEILFDFFVGYSLSLYIVGHHNVFSNEEFVPSTWECIVLFFVSILILLLGLKVCIQDYENLKPTSEEQNLEKHIDNKTDRLIKSKPKKFPDEDYFRHSYNKAIYFEDISKKRTLCCCENYWYILEDLTPNKSDGTPDLRYSPTVVTYYNLHCLALLEEAKKLHLIWEQNKDKIIGQGGRTYNFEEIVLFNNVKYKCDYTLYMKKDSFRMDLSAGRRSIFILGEEEYKEFINEFEYASEYGNKLVKKINGAHNGVEKYDEYQYPEISGKNPYKCSK